MTMKLRIAMYDEAADDADQFWNLPDSAAVIDIDPRLEARIIQEEVWAQTAWPEGECSIAKVIVEARHLEPGARVLGMDPTEWSAVRRAIAHMGDLIDDGTWVPRGGRDRLVDDLPALAAVLARMGGRPGSAD
jgi:hypothetical protein